MRKFMTLFLTTIMLFIFSINSFAIGNPIVWNGEQVLIGDANFDGVINSADALKVLRISVQDPCDRIRLCPEEKEIMDVTMDGIINSADALGILKWSVGEITCTSYFA